MSSTASPTDYSSLALPEPLGRRDLIQLVGPRLGKSGLALLAQHQLQMDLIKSLLAASLMMDAEADRLGKRVEALEKGRETSNINPRAISRLARSHAAQDVLATPNPYLAGTPRAQAYDRALRDVYKRLETK